MKLYGDITKLSGYDLDPVDLIVGGSPCQDLSIAGNRSGLKGERSGLFMEMIRVIKEMRIATNFIQPRWVLWENVPGALSSGKFKGADFSVVLGEFSRLIEPNAPDVPVPSEGWRNSGVLLVTGGGSIAWRIIDAQFWGKTIRDSRTGDVLAMGTPQRRRRIALVVDLRGETAPEILFEQYRMSGNFEPCGTQREDIAGTAAESTGSTKRIMCLNDQGGSQMEVSEDRCATLRAESHQHEPLVCVSNVISFQERSGKPVGGKGILIQEDHVGALSTMNNQYVFDSQPHHEFKEMGEVSQSVSAQYGTGGNNMPFVVDERHDGETVDCLAGNGIDRAETAGCNGKGWTEDVSFTLNTIDRPAVATMQGLGDYKMGDVASSLKQRDSKDATDLVCRVEEHLPVSIGNGQTSQLSMSDKAHTLDTMHDQQAVMVNMSVRRLTPLECTRLQGYPDDWLDIPGASDSQKYKALGNSICLPFWEWLAHRFAEIGNVRTIGSLFDGISGFCLVFKRAGCETLWTSEIDPFCQKVCQYHLDNGDL